MKAKPFLKWAGGKSALIPQLEAQFPKVLKGGQIKHYVEPFLGGGAVFFHIAQNYPIKKASLSDINPDIVLAYTVVQKDPKTLIARLSALKEEYLTLNEEKRKDFYYENRELYNHSQIQINSTPFSREWTQRAARLIFLNKTCYNGLYRQNKKGEFNVPFGRYKHPSIFSEENILRSAECLTIAKLSQRNFDDITQGIDQNTFVYFDPPYRPLSPTADFTAYASNGFTDTDQINLGDYFSFLDKKGAHLMLSNSDPCNRIPKDTFLENIYGKFNIHRVCANRAINRDKSKRGGISELLITNYHR